MCKGETKYSDILIVCGQGTYQNGKYYSEYDDQNVYLEHAVTVKRIVKKYNYTHVVCSGGYTKAETPDLSEAKSFENMWERFISG
jgi:hypothetical protein